MGLCVCAKVLVWCVAQDDDTKMNYLVLRSFLELLMLWAGCGEGGQMGFPSLCRG